MACCLFISRKRRINIYKIKINKSYNFNDYKLLENGRIVFADKNNGIIVKVDDSLINLEVLQLEGRKILNWLEFLNGFRQLKDKKFNTE